MPRLAELQQVLVAFIIKVKMSGIVLLFAEGDGFRGIQDGRFRDGHPRIARSVIVVEVGRVVDFYPIVPAVDDVTARSAVHRVSDWIAIGQATGGRRVRAITGAEEN